MLSFSSLSAPFKRNFFVALPVEIIQSEALILNLNAGLEGMIPSKFPYFFVEFGLSSGYVHVVDNEKKFDQDFGRSILAGLLKLGAEHQKRGAKAECQFVQEKLVREFSQLYDALDWTKQLAN